MGVRVGLQSGQKRWVFASALDWPGWARRGRDEDGALEALDSYRERYASVLRAAGLAVPDGELDVVERAPGTDVIVDFGAPGAVFAADADALHAAEAARWAAALGAAWAAFDSAVTAAAGTDLRRGPRGGGRELEAIVDHVREGERTYVRKLGVRLPPRTPWDEQRDAVTAAVTHPAGTGAWPVRYLVRRAAWHVLDHAWEVEDRAG